MRRHCIHSSTEIWCSHQLKVQWGLVNLTLKRACEEVPDDLATFANAVLPLESRQRFVRYTWEHICIRPATFRRSASGSRSQVTNRGCRTCQSALKSSSAHHILKTHLGRRSSCCDRDTHRGRGHRLLHRDGTPSSPAWRSRVREGRCLRPVRLPPPASGGASSGSAFIEVPQRPWLPATPRR